MDKKRKSISIMTYISTGITALLWLPVICFVIIAKVMPMLQGIGNSIPIIGGADGPTAVYLATSTNSFSIALIGSYFVPVVMLILTIILWVVKINGKNNRSA